MAHFLNTTSSEICDTAADDVICHADLLSDVTDSSLWDLLPESCDLNEWLDVSEDDSVVADIHTETDKYSGRHRVSYNTIVEAELTIENQRASISDGLRRNLSKNAILARENREKKKRYICGLEKAVHDLSQKNKKLVHGCSAMRNTIADLRREVNYLRGVIENQSELSQLLKHVPLRNPVSQVQVNTNLLLCDDGSEMRSVSSCHDQMLSSPSVACESVHTLLMPKATYESLLTEHDYARPAWQSKWNNSSSRRQFGVCLHVADQAASLQLCATCNENAQ